MGVQGRYYTNGNLANAGAPPGPIDRMLVVVDALIAKVRQGAEPRRPPAGAGAAPRAAA